MTTPDVTVTTPATGRGAWPSLGTGGTLSLDGDKPGRFYRSPSVSTVAMPGRMAFQQIRLGQAVSVDDYGVHLAVKAIQGRCSVVADGIFGPNTGAAVAAYQTRNNLVSDGVVGPATAKIMFKPLVASAAAAFTTHPRLAFLVGGHIAWESGFDPGAVGGTSPQDLGLGQINGPAHPTMTVEQRFDPVTAITFVTKLVESNLNAFDAEFDAVLSYNLGQAGCRSWIKAGRPRIWGITDTAKYVASVLLAARTI